MQNKTVEEIALMATEYADTIEGHPCAHRSGLIRGFQDGYLKASENNPMPNLTNTTMMPHKCPVCQGKGLVPYGFYSSYSVHITTNTAPEQCKSCSGSGIIIT